MEMENVPRCRSLAFFPGGQVCHVQAGALQNLPTLRTNPTLSGYRSTGQI